jgi:putative ABC transport system permease protein
MQETLYNATAGHRTLMLYLLVFAAVGLFLAAIGLYGVLAYSVARRTREIGIRIALGAQRGDVLGLVMHEGLRLLCIGLVLGVITSLALGRVLRTFLFGLTTYDPLTLLSVALLLLLVALLACFLPARRAAKVDPMVALRWE